MMHGQKNIKSCRACQATDENTEHAHWMLDT